MTFISVVLPAPFSPSRPWISPRRTVSETLSLAVSSPKRFVMPTSRSRGVSLAECVIDASNFLAGAGGNGAAVAARRGGEHRRRDARAPAVEAHVREDPRLRCDVDLRH